MKIDRDALSDYHIIGDYISQLGITSMTKEQKDLMKRLAKSLLKKQIKMREGSEG